MDTKFAIFVSDIDGTLIDSTGNINQNVLQALSEFRSVGEFTLCTGRGSLSTVELAHALSIKIPCVLYGGAMIYDVANNKILYLQPIDRRINTVLKELLEKEPELSITVYTEKYSVNLRVNETLTTKGVLQDRTAPLAQLSEINRDIIKVLITHDSMQTLQAIKSRYFNPNMYECEAASRHFYEVTAKCVNKGRALSILSEIFGYGSCHKFVAGDGATDLSMKPLARKFYVPKTAQQSVIDKADMIIPPPQDGGVAIALEDAIKICKKSLVANQIIKV